MPRVVSEKVVAILAKLYNREIGAIGIYMDQHVKLDDMRVSKLSESLKADAVEEMKHAEKLAERITYLGRNVMYAKHEVPQEDMVEILDMIRLNIRLENEAIDLYNEGIRLCFEENDNGTRLLLEEILKDEEKHLDQNEALLANIDRYGDQYIVTHLM